MAAMRIEHAAPAAVLLALALATGCVRIDLEGEASAAAGDQALLLSDPGAVVLCPIAAAVSADGASYAALWHEYPPDTDELHLMYARVSASGEVEVPATAVARLDSELAALSLVAIDGGFAVDLVRHGEGRRTAVAIDDGGQLLRRLDADSVDLADAPVRAAGEGDVACGSSVHGPGEVASAFRSQVGGELRLIFELR